MYFRRRFSGPTKESGKFNKLSNKIKPLIKRVAKGAAIICVSLAISSLGAAAEETRNKTGVIAGIAKSAKSPSRTMKYAASVSSTLIACKEKGVDVEDAVTNKIQRSVVTTIACMVFAFGLMWVKEIYEGG